jgi:hypothetical protein
LSGAEPERFHGLIFNIQVVVAGLDPATHLFPRRWMRGSSPRMTGVPDSSSSKSKKP